MKTNSCRKCLTRDMDQSSYFESLHDYIDQLDETIKAEQSVYRYRLQQCTECERLIDAMCNACGCYVELRASIDRNYCPYHKW